MNVGTEIKSEEETSRVLPEELRVKAAIIEGTSSDKVSLKTLSINFLNMAKKIHINEKEVINVDSMFNKSFKEKGNKRKKKHVLINNNRKKHKTKRNNRVIFVDAQV